MQLIEVNNPALAKEFIRANVDLNRDNSSYIRPIDKEINEVFDPASNKAFRTGEMTRWILKDDEGRLIGEDRRLLSIKNTKIREMRCQWAASDSSIASTARRRRICCSM